MTTPRSLACPTCRGAVTRAGNSRFPFCSERCRLVDLGRWVNEEYRIPEEPSEAALDAIEQLPDPDREQ